MLDLHSNAMLPIQLVPSAGLAPAAAGWPAESDTSTSTTGNVTSVLAALPMQQALLLMNRSAGLLGEPALAHAISAGAALNLTAAVVAALPPPSPSSGSPSPSSHMPPGLVALPPSPLFSSFESEDLSTWIRFQSVIPIASLVVVLVILTVQLLVFYCCCIRHEPDKIPKGKSPDEIPPPQQPHMSWFSYITLQWIKPLLFRAQEGKALSHMSMLPLWVDIRLTFDKAYPLWEAQLEGYRTHGTKPRLWPVFSAVFGWQYVIMGLIRLTSMALSLFSPIILRRYLDALTNADDAAAVLNGALLVALGLGATMLNTHASVFSTRIAMELGGVVGCINFRRITRLSKAESARLGSGFIQQCWSEDTGRVTSLLEHTFNLFSTFATLILAFCLLYATLGIAALAPIVVTFSLSLIDIGALIIVVRYLHRLMYVRDTRIKLMHEFVKGIRTIKAGGVTNHFAEEVKSIRKTELGLLSFLKMAGAFQGMIGLFKASAVFLCTFGVYMLMPSHLMCGADNFDEWCALDAPMVISALAYIDMVVTSLNAIPAITGEVANALNSYRRIYIFHTAEDAPIMELTHKEHAPWSKGDPPPPASPSRARKDAKASGKEESTEGKEDAEGKGGKNGKGGKQPPTPTDPNAPVAQFVNASFTFQTSTNAAKLTAPGEAAPAVEPDKLVLHGLNVTLHKGRLVAVVGPSGSGKTAFLMALMRELSLKSGTISVNADMSGWSAQTAILRTGTIRDNITFDCPFEPRRYRRVVEACALDTDLKEMDHGDGTLVGDRGTRLSGGQRQRISLARACYSRAELVLLDDPLAAVDRITAQHLHQHVLRGVLQGRTVVCVLQQTRVVKDFDYVYMLKDGAIEQEGVPAEMAAFARDNAIEACLPKPRMPRSSDEDDDEEEDGGSDEGDADSGAKIAKDLSAWMSQHLENEHEIEERRKLGGVSRGIYRYYYAMSGGAWAFVPILIALFAQRVLELLLHGCIAVLAGHDEELAKEELYKIGAVSVDGYTYHLPDYVTGGTPTSYQIPVVSSNAPTTHLAPATSLSALGTIGPHAAGASVVMLLDIFGRDVSWKDAIGRAKHHVSNVTNSISLFVARGKPSDLFKRRWPMVVATAGFSGGLLLIGTLTLVLQTIAGLRAARRVHDRMLKSVLGARTVFFDLNPAGRLLNRFIHDTNCVDEKTPNTVRDFLENISKIISGFVMQLYVLHWFALLMLPFTAVYYRCISLYRPAALECQRLSLVVGSRLMQTVAEMLDGGAPLARAYGTVLHAEVKHLRYLEMHQTCDWNGFLAARWLGLVLDLLGQTVSALVIVGCTVPPIVGLPHIALTSTGVGFVGLALNYATTISSAMAGLVDVLTRLELDFISVERMQQYTEELELEPPDESMPETTADWPFRGAVTYKKVSMRYQLTMPLVLREISFTIGAGERVGVVGRTGSGKSSIVACLFRLSEIQSGSIMIDGLDTRNVRLCDLRRSIGVVMQDSLVFAGNARRNLFAPPEVPEAELLQALVDVRLCQSVEEAAVMIDVEIDFNNLSAGQRQLLCIARMLVRKAKLMVMDEATANLDEESDRFVQENLIGAFSGATVMTIAHRTGTVIRSDRILVVSHGQVVEEGLPAELARNSSSKFAQLLAAGKDISE